MNDESPDNPFRLGNRYKNRKGFFTVVSLAGDMMRIRWDSGEEIADTIASQARILRNMQRASVPTTPRPNFIAKPVPPPSSLGPYLAEVFNRHADFGSPIAQRCRQCGKDLIQRPTIMVGSEAFCYCCAKSQYPKVMDEARRARNREARRIAPARKEYKKALHAFELVEQQYAIKREEAAAVRFYTKRNMWIIAWAVAIPCGIVLPIIGLIAILPVFLVIQLIWDRKRTSRLAAFDCTHSRPVFDRTEPSQNFVPDPIVSLHPDCSAPSFINIGYDREWILRHDDFMCQCCQSRFPTAELEIHHLLPRAQGGSDSIRNLITLCKPCHFREDWFDHVHKFNQRRILEKRMERFNPLRGKLPRPRSYS